MEEEINNIKDVETVDINTLVNTFTNAIIQTANLTIGKSTTNNRKPKVPWWNQKIKSAIEDKYKALKQFKLSKTQEDLIELKKHRARTRYLIKTSKKTSWENFTNSINEKTDTKIVWNKIQSLKGLNRNRKINLINMNTDALINEELVANQLREYFSQNSSNTNYTTQFQTYKHEREKETIPNSLDQNQIDQIQLNLPITMQEIIFTLTKCKSHSPGPDNIPYLVYKTSGQTP